MRQGGVLDVLSDLLAGNERFREGRAENPGRSAAHRRASAAGQAPKAAVLSCSDSRVSPEILFDQGIGDLFVVRTAGHVVDRAALGSLEYAVLHLRVPVIVVLGHTGCGAVTAAVSGESAPGQVSWVLGAIRRAMVTSAAIGGDPVERVAREHVRRSVARLLDESGVLREEVERHRLAIAGAFYDLESGRVEFA